MNHYKLYCKQNPFSYNFVTFTWQFCIFHFLQKKSVNTVIIAKWKQLQIFKEMIHGFSTSHTRYFFQMNWQCPHNFRKMTIASEHNLVYTTLWDLTLRSTVCCITCRVSVGADFSSSFFNLRNVNWFSI